MAKREGMRRGSRRSFSGLVITVALHAGIFWAVKEAHSHPQEPLIGPRDFVKAEMVKLGKPRDKFWLPKKELPPPPPPPDAMKISKNPDGGAAKVVEAPKVTDPNLSKGMKNALARANALIPLEEQEGDPNGSKTGTSDHAEGDQYIATIKGLLMQNYFLPAGISSDQITTPPEITFRIDQQNGNLSAIKLTKSSGNPLVNDACVSAAQLTRQVPKPPPGAKVPGLRVSCEK